MTPTMGVPTQYWSPSYPSYQVPHLGEAYATFGFIYPTSTAVSRYPHVPLIDTLKAGKVYCVTYYVSLWDDCRFSVDKFGALLTSTPFDCSVGSQNLYTGYTPQIVSTPGVLYDDTLNWMEVSGTFMATGTEAYLTLGNFFPNATHTYSVSYPAGVRNIAEYYLDDVSVEAVDIARAKNDTTVMQGDSAIVGANLGEANLYNWQPTAGLSCTNCPNPKASPTITTTYTVTKTQCHVVTSDVVTVTVSPTGIQEAEALEASVKILPNPTNGLVVIKSKFDIGKVELLNLTGQVLLSEDSNAKEYQLQLQDFAEGIYFVKCTYSNGISVARKLIKE